MSWSWFCVYQSVQDGGLNLRERLLMMSFQREEFVSGKENENGLGLRLGSGFRCGVMENGGRFHGYSGSLTPDTLTSTFLV